jgi:hypothetical protein
MTGPADPVVEVVAVVMGTLRDAFKPDSSFPPENGTDIVRFFAGEGPATAAWDAHTNDTGCDVPFLWVRVMRRYRTEQLPAPAVRDNPCGLPRAVAIEVGVGRCAVIEQEPDWGDYEAEASVSLDDSWRIELALCAAAKRLRADNYIVAADEISPYGPEGGIIAWTGIVYVQFD